MSATRYPIVIIGGGIAGLTAALKLHEEMYDHILLERFDRCGGRLNSRQGEGWVADHGAPFVMRSQRHLAEFVRFVGMDQERVSIQGPVYELHADGSIHQPEGGGLDPDRLSINGGFRELTRLMAVPANARTNCSVRAIHWDDDSNAMPWQRKSPHFWFEDEEGEPIRNAATHKVLKGSGVILATTATAATQITSRSPALAAVSEITAKVKYNSTFVGMFKVPRLNTPWFALEGTDESKISWLALEERKAPGRVDEGFSLLVVHANDEWSTKLIDMKDRDALQEMWGEVQSVVEGLPEKPISQTWKRWHVSRPTTEPIGGTRDKLGNFKHWPTRPKHIPFTLAGEYLYGRTIEAAALSGEHAAEHIMAQFPKPVKRKLINIRIGQ